MILNITQLAFIVLILLALYKRDISIFLYVVFLPINTILPSTYNVLGTVSYTNILFMVAFYHLIFWKSDIPQTTIRRISLRIIYIFLAYLLYSDFRHAYLGILPFYKDFNPYIEGIRNIIRWIPLSLLVRKMDNEMFDRLIFKAIVVSITILALSVAFAYPLFFMGFKVGFSTEFEYRQNILMPEFMRNSGFLADGDFNVMGALFNMIFAFCLSYFDITKIYKRKDALICLAVSLTGVFLTGSRMAVLTLIIILTYSFWKTSSLQKLVKYSVYILTFLAILWQMGMFDFILNRLSQQNTVGELSLSEKYSRLNRWISFFEYSTSSINRLVFGYDSIHFFTGREYRDPHNLFLRMLYYGGIVFVSLFIYQLIRLINYSIYENTRFRIMLVLIPCLISSMIIGQHTWIYFLLLIVSINDVVT